jgi:two-component system, OmpR family, sensor histidine kinase KdpD
MNTSSPDFDQERKRLLLAVFNTVSHDLKTPLACILGSLEIMERMKETLGTQDRDVLVHTAIMEARKLDNLISDMLDKAQPK